MLAMSGLSLQQVKDLMTTPEPAGLGPGPRSGVQSEAALTKALDESFRGSKVASDRVQLIRALIFLWHDHLDTAHRIAQEIQTADGAFVHGIVHRREPDYGNAAYWFRRVGLHPAFAELAANAGALAGVSTEAALKAKLIPNGKWDPMGMISACEQASVKRWVETLRKVQQVETESILNWLLRG